MSLREYYNELKRIPIEVKRLESITNENAKRYYDRRHTIWLINYSDTVKGDGVELTKAERVIKIPLGVYNEVYACETKDGLPLTELDFIRQENDFWANQKEEVKAERNPIYYKRIEIYLKYLGKREKELKETPRQQNKISYIWQGNADKELPELYNLMIKNNLIAEETNYKQFKAVFTGQPIDDIKPIKWIKSNRLLAYFLDSVFNGQYWPSIAGNGKLFQNNKGKTITANDLSVAKKGYIDFGQPKDYEKIDLIISDINKH